jgi:hypothetical protein
MEFQEILYIKFLEFQEILRDTLKFVSKYLKDAFKKTLLYPIGKKVPKEFAFFPILHRIRWLFYFFPLQSALFTCLKTTKFKLTAL